MNFHFHSRIRKGTRVSAKLNLNISTVIDGEITGDEYLARWFVRVSRQ